MKTSIDDIQPYETKDGSMIRELMHPEVHDCRNISLAMAEIGPGKKTALHHHICSEEIYHIVMGEGSMTLGTQEFAIGKGDTVLIRPGMSHQVKNTGKKVLKILCCCAPPYSHSDTKIM